MPTALSIAASDSGGACGVQADIKTFSALGVYATSVVTAVTAQNSMEMADVHEIPTSVVRSQLHMVLKDLKPKAVKVGMIGAAANYEAISAELREDKQCLLVVDPVVTCYRGCAFVLGDDAIQALRASVLPLTDVFAPSIPDAEVILRASITTPADMEEAARALHALGPRLVVLKGGHLDGDPVDVVCDDGGVMRLSGARIPAPHDNGSGCAFSSAIAAFLAHGLPPQDAVNEARVYLSGALAHGFAVGQGHGPVHFFHNHWENPSRQRSAAR